MPKCNEDGCKVLVTGECVNGLPLTNCSHYSVSDTLLQEIDIPRSENDREKNIGIPTASSSSNNNTNNYAVNGIDTHSGRALKVDEVNRISVKRRTKLIILAGMPNAGKTTLLLSLMHLFATKSNYQGYIFSGSETLYDFEEKSHPSKIDSDNNNPDTDRTTHGPPTFLHLQVAEQQAPEIKQDFVFTDISGESFRILKDSTDESRKFDLGKRADHFALFFDSEMLSSLDKRASARIAGLGILRSLTEAGTLKHPTRLQIIFSRWDLYKGKKNAKEFEEFFVKLKDEIQTLYSDLFELEFCEISSRSKENVFAIGHGLEKLFPIWYSYSRFDKAEDHPGENMNWKNPSLRQFMQYEFI